MAVGKGVAVLVGTAVAVGGTGVAVGVGEEHPAITPIRAIKQTKIAIRLNIVLLLEIRFIRNRTWCVGVTLGVFDWFVIPPD